MRIGLLRTGLPAGLEPTFEATKFFEPKGYVFANACIIAVVAVTPETGEVVVERIIGAEDWDRTGWPSNPRRLAHR